MNVRHVLLVGVLLAGGCTKWKKEAENLQSQLVRTEQSLSETRATLAAREGTIEELEAEVASLEAKIADLEASIEALEQDLDAEREKSSRILAERGGLRAEVAAMKEALAELEARKRAAEARVAEFRDLLARFRSLIDAGKLDVRIVDGRMVVRLDTDVLFPSGSADLSPEGAAAIDEVAAVLREIPDRRFQVEGHTDNVPIRNAKYPSNWYLAAARAINVVERMTAAGLPERDVSAAAFADTRPVAENDTAEGRALNRRIEIVVVPDLSTLPGYEELQALQDE